jgi:hypothetical protein
LGSSHGSTLLGSFLTLREELEIIGIVVAAIEKHARGDVEALARGIIEELRAAGPEIRRIDVMQSEE